MAADGRMDTARALDDRLPVEIFEKVDHPYGRYHGGMAGIHEVARLVYKKPNSSHVLGLLRATNTEQLAIDHAMEERRPLVLKKYKTVAEAWDGMCPQTRLLLKNPFDRPSIGRCWLLDRGRPCHTGGRRSGACTTRLSS